MRETDPPRCSVHRDQMTAVVVAPDHARSPGFYGRAFTLEEMADLMNLMLEHGLDDELSAARVAVRRVMEQLEGEMSPAEYARLAEVIFKGANSIARLLRTRMDISIETAEGLAGIFEKALERAERDLKENEHGEEKARLLDEG